ncbi:MAG: ABC transporter permease [Tepidiformaceae bacterium]
MGPLVDIALLTRRALRESIRQPAVEVSNIFIPLFFFAVTVGAVGSVATSAFKVTNFTGFQVPVAVLQAVASASGAAGLGMTQDIQRGYLDKLSLTPSPRISIVLGRMAADSVRAMLLTALIIVVGLAVGSGFASGPLGMLVLLLGAGIFGLAYSGFGMAIAIRTGSPQAAQAGFLLFFPLLFLAPAFAPTSVFSPWMQFAASINPITYVLEGMRSLVLDGWDGAALAKAAISMAGLGVFTFSLTFLALRWRTNR